MPNEQTSVPLFASGEVLTAANMNLSAGTGVPVFTNTTTRDAAFGGAGEKVLAEGQLCYLSSTNVVQYYDGAAWATVGPSSAGGLVCVKAETAFTAVAGITLDNVFTSTYTDYIIKIRTTASSTGNAFFQLRVGGVTNTTNWVQQELNANSTSVTASSASAQTQMRVGLFESDVNDLSTQLNVYSPAQAVVTTVFGNNVYTGGTSATNIAYFNSSGYNNNATAFDGFYISIASGTITGVYSVYGYSKVV